MRNRGISGLALVAVLLGLVAGCAAGPATTPTPATATVVDVRTAEEYAEGHLQGAVNIDLMSQSFPADIGALPKDAEYVVYCRSGNRSAQAATIMRQAGLTVQDAGGIDKASASTGLPIVTD